MPTYQYQCKNCGFELEELQSMSEVPLKTCPRCGTDSLARIIGIGSGLIFKGTGFYLTDYKKQTGSPVVPTKAKQEAGKEGKNESKSEGTNKEKTEGKKKDDSKPAPKADTPGSGSKE